jgi:hypothetical protein
MRRLRRIDVLPGDPTAVDAMFRDTYMEPDGHESILHEYALRAVCDGDGRLLDVEAEPHVLPHIECPDAAPNVVELRGQLTRDLRTIVPVTLEGVRSCTHLSDLLRSLSCVSRLQAIRPA